MDRLFYNVGELSTPARSAVEGLVGHPLRDDQQLYIVALEAADEPPAADRQAAWKELQAIITAAHDHVRQSGATAEDIERTIDEACDDVRYGS